MGYVGFRSGHWEIVANEWKLLMDEGKRQKRINAEDAETLSSQRRVEKERAQPGMAVPQQDSAG
jgi:hypothetical protein